MKTIPIYTYIYFGTALRFLQDAQQGFGIHSNGGVIDNIDIFLADLDEFNLPVTRRAARDLVDFRDEIFKLPKNDLLKQPDATKLKKITEELRKIMDFESYERQIYTVTEKRLDTHKLMDSPDKLFAEGVFNNLSEIAKYDFIEAGKCICFERSTAAAFHLLRGTEAELWEFYCKVVKTKRLKDPTWGQMLDALRKRRKPPSKTLLDNLTNIKDNYRDRTDHPKLIYNIDEAQDLLSICVAVVNEMIKETPSEKH